MEPQSVLTLTPTRIEKQLKMPLIEVWIAALLGGFQMEQRGSFYQTQEVWVNRCRGEEN